MSQTDIKEFFDMMAPKWDDMEIKKDEEILNLLKRIGIKKGDRVLDLGCGTGRITSLLHSLSEADVLGIDISSNMIDIARNKYLNQPYARFISGDFLTMDLNDKFDDIVIYNAFPHFMPASLLAKKLNENIVSGGRFAIVHSLGRKQLCSVHSTCDDKTTRPLQEVEAEAEVFKPYFDIILSEESENYFIIVGQKR